MSLEEEHIGSQKGRFVAIFLVATAIASLFFVFFDDPDWRLILSAYYYTFVLWEGNYRFFFFAIRRYPRFDQVKIRLGVTILFILIYSLVVSIVWEGIMFQFQITLRKFFAIYLFGVGVTALISSINGAASYFILFRQSIEEKEAIKRSNIESELNALTSQVNPHFLFNSLNALMSLIQENQELAIRFTQKLSDVYRYTLQGEKRDLVSLKEELVMVENYIFLMQIRFGENLKIRQEIPNEAMALKLPVLTLQLIIENAVKHNAVSRTKPLTIRISVDEHCLEVWNNRNIKKEGEPGTGTGLDNIRKRYALYTGDQVQVRDEKDFFSIRVPLIKVKQYEGADH